MREIILIGIAMTVMLAGIVAWAAPRHPAVVTSQFDPFPARGERKEFAHSGVAQRSYVAK